MQHVLVVRRTGIEVAWTEGRDLWWHDTVDTASPEHTPEAFDAEHPLFLLYTSGTTGGAKGIVHTTGGYLTQASYTHYACFDVKPETDVYWCTADIGWVTGHTYIVYGPLSNGVTQVLYEGTPMLPERAPPFRGHRKVRRHDLLHRADARAHVHEMGPRNPRRPRPVQPAAAGHRRRADQPRGVALVPRRHRRQQHPHRRHLVADRDRRGHDLAAAGRHRGQTRRGDGPAARHLRERSSTTTPTASSAPSSAARGTAIWCSTSRGRRCCAASGATRTGTRHTYWSRFAEQGWYFAGDGARYDDDGAIWVLGRIDDVMNVSGHRISTAEVESALVGHSGVAEAAVVGATDEDHRAGDRRVRHPEGPRRRHPATNRWSTSCAPRWPREISPIARPREIHVVPELPKTRSGKIMRRLLRDVAEGRELGDTSTLVDPSVFDAIRASK